MEAFILVMYIIVGLVFLIGSYAYQHAQYEKIKDELYKLVSQTGAQNITIERERMVGNRGACLLMLTYKDAKGKWQARQVSRQLGSFGQAQGEFMWNKPLINEPDVNLSSRLSSKEQIISDMDAEIKRLQQELEKARKES